MNTPGSAMQGILVVGCLAAAGLSGCVGLVLEEASALGDQALETLTIEWPQPGSWAEYLDTKYDSQVRWTYVGTMELIGPSWQPTQVAVLHKVSTYSSGLTGTARYLLDADTGVLISYISTSRLPGEGEYVLGRSGNDHVSSAAWRAPLVWGRELPLGTWVGQADDPDVLVRFHQSGTQRDDRRSVVEVRARPEAADVGKRWGGTLVFDATTSWPVSFDAVEAKETGGVRIRWGVTAPAEAVDLPDLDLGPFEPWASVLPPGMADLPGIGDFARASTSDLGENEDFRQWMVPGGDPIAVRVSALLTTQTYPLVPGVATRSIECCFRTWLTHAESGDDNFFHGTMWDETIGPNGIVLDQGYQFSAAMHHEALGYGPRPTSFLRADAAAELACVARITCDEAMAISVDLEWSPDAQPQAVYKLRSTDFTDIARMHVDAMSGHIKYSVWNVGDAPEWIVGPGY